MSIATHALPLDLHVLGLPLAFILSQDQTLLCIFSISLSSILGLRFLLRNQRSRICFRYFACTAYSSLVNELPMSVRNRSRSSRPGASLVPLFPNGIAKVLLFPEPPNFSGLFFDFFSCGRTTRHAPDGAGDGATGCTTEESRGKGRGGARMRLF